LSDSEFILENRTQDIRGLDVYDKDGEEIGTVEDLYADTEERKVRCLEVGAWRPGRLTADLRQVSGRLSSLERGGCTRR
jgi:sporulation protein YlmC with PRC-barrel domain